MELNTILFFLQTGSGLVLNSVGNGQASRALTTVFQAIIDNIYYPVIFIVFWLVALYIKKLCGHAEDLVIKKQKQLRICHLSTNPNTTPDENKLLDVQDLLDVLKVLIMEDKNGCDSAVTAMGITTLAMLFPFIIDYNSFNNDTKPNSQLMMTVVWFMISVGYSCTQLKSSFDSSCVIHKRLEPNNQDNHTV